MTSADFCGLTRCITAKRAVWSDGFAHTKHLHAYAWNYRTRNGRRSERLRCSCSHRMCSRRACCLPIYGGWREDGPCSTGRKASANPRHSRNCRHSLYLGRLCPLRRRPHQSPSTHEAGPIGHHCGLSRARRSLSFSPPCFPGELHNLLACVLGHLLGHWLASRLWGGISLVRNVRPNPSLKRSANGRPPGPVWRYAVHFRQPGPGVLPLSSA